MKVLAGLMRQFAIGVAVGVLVFVPVAFGWPERLMPDGTLGLALLFAYGVGGAWAFAYFLWNDMRVSSPLR
jgi:hypothetical protein